jgi:hypothetical protein
LERWRRSGLLPRVSRCSEGRYGTTCVLAPGSIEIATCLGRHARRGRGTAELAILAWLDGAPINGSVVVRAVRQVFAELTDLVTKTYLEQIEAYLPPADFRGEDPAFDQIEATARWMAEIMGPVGRKMRARLAAAGYGGDAMALANVFTLMLGRDPELPPEEADRVMVATGLKEPIEPGGRLPEDAMSTGFGWLLARGVQELTGQDPMQFLTMEAQHFTDESRHVSRRQLDLARRDLARYMEMLFQLQGWDTAQMPCATESGTSAKALAALCLAWATVRRLLPVGTTLESIMEAGVEVARRQQQIPAMAA